MEGKYRNFSASIYFNGEFKENIFMEYYGNELGKTLMEKSLRIDKYMDFPKDKGEINVRIKILGDEETIYDSVNLLNRKFIIFKNGTEFNSSLKPGYGYSALFPKGNFSCGNVEYEEIEEYSRSFSLIHFMPEKNYFIKFCDKTFFKSEEDEKLSFIFTTDKRVNYIEKQIKYQCINSEETIKIMFNNFTDLKNYIFLINGKIIPPYEFERGNDFENPFLIVRLSDFKDEYNKLIFTVSNTITGRKILEKNFYFINGLSYSFNKKVYITPEDYDNSYVKISLNGNVSNLSLYLGQESILKNYGNGIINIIIPFIKIQRNNGDIFFESESIWHENFSNEMNFSIINSYEFPITVKFSDKEISPDEDGIYNAAQTIRNYSGNRKNSLIIIEFHDYEIDCLALYDIYFTEMFNKNLTLKYKDGVLMVENLDSFIGRPLNAKMILKNTETENTIKIPLNDNIDYFSLDNPIEGLYEYTILRDQIFTKGIVLSSGNFYLGNEEHLPYLVSRIRLSHFTYVDQGREKKTELLPVFLEDIKYLGRSYIECENQVCMSFTGNLFYFKDGNKILFSKKEGTGKEGNAFYKLNPVRLNIINENVMTITNQDGDGLLSEKFYSRSTGKYENRITDRLENSLNRKSFNTGDFYIYTLEETYND